VSNSLTGDFEAVLQVSGGTINRLLASLHQNAFVNTKLPSFPHVVWMRLGDYRAVDGVRGVVQAQLSVPHVDLIQGATDRFLLEVGARVRYKPDPGTNPLPQFIHGTVRAEYRIEDIDPKCLGWGGRAADYLWVRVVKDSVEFNGTWADDGNVFQVPHSLADLQAADQATHASITRQIAVLLATQFEAKPHRVSRRFRRGSMRSLSDDMGSAVAVPVGLTGEPAGDIASIGYVWLQDADFGIAVSREFIESVAQPALDGIQGLSRSFHTSVDLGAAGGAEVDYSVRVDSATLEWHGLGSYGLIKLKLTGQGWCPRLYTSGVANIDPPDAKDLRMSFTAEQDLLVGFDPVSERLTVEAPWFLPPVVDVNYGGPYAGTVISRTKGAISDALNAHLPGALANVQPQLDDLTSYQRKADLIAQLKTFDDQAYARFDQAVFSDDGVVLRGQIPLTPRQRPVANFEKTVEQDGFSAFQSWIPGGRVDNFAWSWSWVGQQGNAGTAGFQDRFVLRRPPAKTGRFGLGIGLTEPLPGIDGGGTVCLTINGVQVDAVTGRLVPVQSARQCHGYRLNTNFSVGGGRLFLHDMPQLSHDVPLPQMALLNAAGAPTADGVNTLLIYVDEAWDQATASALKRGLEATVREDAGLLLLILLREGRLSTEGSRVAAAVHELAEPLGVAAIVNEDVHGGWAAAFALPSQAGEPGWRLISPGGGLVWMHDGRVTGEALAGALNEGLFPSRGPKPAMVGVAVGVGARVPGHLLDPFDAPEAHCPPTGLDRVGMAGSVVGFVQQGSRASVAQLQALAAQHAQRDDQGPLVLAVVDGAGARDVARLKAELGLEFDLVPDGEGVISDRFGVRVWPTTLRLDGAGTVSAIEIGAGHRPNLPDEVQGATPQTR
jgi:hypothetical protein